jgi:hypothetical protein
MKGRVQNKAICMPRMHTAHVHVEILMLESTNFAKKGFDLVARFSTLFCSKKRQIEFNGVMYWGHANCMHA